MGMVLWHKRQPGGMITRMTTRKTFCMITRMISSMNTRKTFSMITRMNTRKTFSMISRMIIKITTWCRKAMYIWCVRTDRTWRTFSLTCYDRRTWC